MPLQVTCSCGNRIWVENAKPGSSLACPACNRPVTLGEQAISTQPLTAGGAASSDDFVDVRRPAADARGRWSPGLLIALVAALVLGVFLVLVGIFSILFYATWFSARSRQVAAQQAMAVAEEREMIAVERARAEEIRMLLDRQHQAPPEGRMELLRPDEARREMERLRQVRVDRKAQLDQVDAPPNVKELLGVIGDQPPLPARINLATLEGHSGPVNAVAFSADGRFVVSAAGDPGIKVWDIASQKCTATLDGHARAIHGLAFSPDGRWLASAGEDQTVRVWEFANRQTQHVLKGHTGKVLCVAFAPDGRTLASGSDDRSIRLWEVETGRQVELLDEHRGSVTAVRFASDGRTLFAGTMEQGGENRRGNVQFTDVPPTRVTMVPGFDGPVLALAVAPDSKMLAIASVKPAMQPGLARPGTIHLHSLVEPREFTVLSGYAFPVTGLAYSPDNQTLASACADGTVRLRDLAAKQDVAIYLPQAQLPRCLAYSLDGNVLAIGCQNGMVKLWRLEDRP